MRLIQGGRFAKESYADLGIKLYRVNDEICDEVQYNEGKYIVLHRCGVVPYTLNHKYKTYFTDLKTIIYPLAESDYWEEEIDAPELKSFGEKTTFSVTNGEFVTENVEFEVDHRYKEELRHFIGSDITIDKVQDDVDDDDNAYVMAIANNNPTSESYYTQTLSNNVYFPRCFTFNGITEKSNNKLLSLGRQQSDGSYITSITTDLDYSYSHENYWYCYQYERCGYTKDDIKGRTPVDSYMYYYGDFNTTNMGRLLKNNYTLYLYTYIYNPSSSNVTNSMNFNVGGLNGYSIYVNGVGSEKNQSSFTSGSYNVLAPGWNLIEIILQTANNRGCGLTPTTGAYFVFFNRLKTPDYSGNCNFSRMNYNVQTLLGNSELNIKTKNPFRSLGNITDRFVRIDPNFPEKANLATITKGWQYAEQRKIGTYIVTGLENYTTSPFKINGNDFNVFSFELNDAKVDSTLCESDKLTQTEEFTDENQISINGTTVSICLNSNSQFQELKDVEILYLLNEDVFEPVLNQLDVHQFLSDYYYDRYDWNKIKFYLMDAPTQPITFPTVFGEYYLSRGPIFYTNPGYKYILRKQINSSYINGIMDGTYPSYVITYDNNLNKNGWYAWEDFVKVCEKNTLRLCSGTFTCPENVYAVQTYNTISGYASNNLYTIGTPNNLYDLAENYVYLKDAYPTGVTVEKTSENSVTFNNTTDATVSVNMSKLYGIPIKSGKRYIAYWESDDYSKNVICRISGWSGKALANSAYGYNNEQYGFHYVVLIPNSASIEIKLGFNIPANTKITISNIGIYEFENSSNISNLLYTIDGIEHSCALKTPLPSNKEFVYSPERKKWNMLGAEANASNIMNNSYSEDDIPLIVLKKGQRIQSLDPTVFFTIVANYKTKRKMDIPNNVSLSDGYKTGDNGYGYIEWDSVIGATEYRVVLNNEVVATFDAEYGHRYIYNFTKEERGTIYIEALNDLGVITRTNDYSIETVPSAVEFDSFDSDYKDNRYYITAKFRKTSQTADQYLLFYSLDGGNNNIIKYENDKSGDEVSEQIVVTSISDNITFQLLTSNDSGDNDYNAAVDLKPCDGFDVWTYKESSKQLLTTFYDNFEDEDYYNIKYRIDNGNWTVMQVDGSDKPNERLIEYLNLQPDQTMDMCLAPVRNGYTNIYSPPITVSKELDTTLLAPKEFKGTKLSDGKIQFTWLDDYWIDSAFELYYTYSDGTSGTVKVDQDVDYGSYVYSTDNYGFINARVKMVWEFGESAYTDFIVVYNIPEVEKAPMIEGKCRDENDVNKLRVIWQQYDFIKNYIVYFTVDGIQQQFESPDSEYLWDIPDDGIPHAISCRVQAKFINDSLTDISESISFSVVQSSERQQTVVYATTDVDYPEYTTVYTKGLENYSDVYTYSMNSYDTSYPIYMKRYEPNLEQVFNLYSDFWGHNIGPEYLFSYDIINKFDKDFKIEQIQYSNVTNDDLLQTMIYRNTSSEYRIMAEFVKMVICCLGDSITAGHPNFWAETGTGIINSQYEYWLSRRLKDEYDVVNKGYGQEKTQDMVDRFERDVLPTNPNYCIFLGGTNDYVNTYIVRCNRKLCSVSF